MSIQSLRFQILYFILVLYQLNSLASPEIRTGIAQLNLFSLETGYFNIQYKVPLTSSNYNNVVGVSYVYNYEPSTGININAVCDSSLSQSGIKCLVSANNSNTNNIVFMSYISSNQGNFLVGSILITYNFIANVTSMNPTIVAPVPINSNYANFTINDFVRFEPIISGISSLDSDFSLNFGNLTAFNAKNRTISFNLQLSQFHSKDITIRIGYFIFDPKFYQISFSKDQKFDLANFDNLIETPTLFAIKMVTPQQNSRRLQSYPINTTARASSLSTSSSVISTSKVPIVSSNTSNSSTYIDAFRLGNTSHFKMTYKRASVNKTTFITYQTSDNIVDPKVVKPTKRLSTDNQLLLPSNLKLSIDSYNSIQAEGNSSLYIRGAVAPPSGTNPSSGLEQLGTDNFNFKNLFNTNGFMILTASTSVDQFIFFEVSFEDPTTGDQQKVYYMSIIKFESEMPPICQAGSFLAKILVKVDYLTQGYRYRCIKCTNREYFDPETQSCLPFPILTPSISQIDCFYGNSIVSVSSETCISSNQTIKSTKISAKV